MYFFYFAVLQKSTIMVLKIIDCVDFMNSKTLNINSNYNNNNNTKIRIFDIHNNKINYYQNNNNNNNLYQEQNITVIQS